MEKKIKGSPGGEATADAATAKEPLPLTKLSISLGAVSPPLAKQYAEQGLVVSPEMAARHQIWSNAIATARIQGFITWSAAQKAYDRVSAAIWRDLRQAAEKAREA